MVSYSEAKWKRIPLNKTKKHLIGLVKAQLWASVIEYCKEITLHANLEMLPELSSPRIVLTYEFIMQL